MSDPTSVPGAATTEPGNANTEPANQPAAANAADPKAQEPAAPAVPEAYEFTMPEGVALDDAAASEFTAIAKELKLDQATASKLTGVAAAMMQRQVEARTALIADWAKQTEADPEIGGEKLAQNMANARKAVDTFGGDALKQVLNETGLGNHPAVVKAFLKASAFIREDDGLPQSTSNGAPRDPAKILFPNMN